MSLELIEKTLESGVACRWLVELVVQETRDLCEALQVTPTEEVAQSHSKQFTVNRLFPGLAVGVEN